MSIIVAFFTYSFSAVSFGQLCHWKQYVIVWTALEILMLFKNMMYLVKLSGKTMIQVFTNLPFTACGCI